MISRREIVQRARVVIARELAIDINRVTEGADLRRELRADSLDMATLPAAIEEEFGVSITDDEAEFCQTVGTAIDLIEAKLETAAFGDTPSRSTSRRRA